MKLKYFCRPYSQIIFTAFLFLAAIAMQGHADDKKKLPLHIPAKHVGGTKIFKPTGKPSASPGPLGKPSGVPPISKPRPPQPPAKKDGTVRTPDGKRQGTPGKEETGAKDKKLDPSTKTGSPSRPQPLHTHREGSNTVTRNDRGAIRVIERPGLRVQRDSRGGRAFVREEPNGRRIVGTSRHDGYMQRTYIRPNGRLYVQRTYVAGGRRYAVAYRSLNYRGVTYYRYAPAYYFHPAFYGWAYSPWAMPVAYNWGWTGSPWYVGYGYYFTPYAAYTSASLWLTDYLLAENLQSAYAAAAEAAVPEQTTSDNRGENRVALSPEIKQMIASEVQRQLTMEKAAALQGTQAGTNQAEEIPSALDPAQKIFVVASNLDLVDDSGKECAVTAGDILLRTGKEADADNKIAISVQSSKQGDCPVDTNSELTVSDLQEMHNQFREKLDAGLKALASNQGKNGLPAAPDTGTLSGEVAPPSPDSNVEAALQEQEKSVDEVERQAAKP